MSTATVEVIAARRSVPRDLALIAVFAALIAALALIPGVPVGIGVPITLQTLGVFLTALVLGPWRGLLAVALYLVVGLIGIPVFSGGTGGIGVLVRPSAGYLIGFALAALLAGALAYAAVRRIRRRGVLFLALFGSALAASLLLVHPLGIAGMMLNARIPFEAALATDVVFLPGDVLKNLVAAGLAVTVHAAFPWLAGRRVAAPTAAA